MKLQYWIIPFIIAIVMVALVIKKQYRDSIPKDYNKGEMVYIRISSQVGQVIGYSGSRYEVRLKTLNSYETINFYSYELRSYNERQGN